MARPNATRPRPLGTARAGPATTPGTSWRELPRVARLTTQILRAHETAGRAQVDAAVEIGRRIAQVKGLLEGDGRFSAWSREAVPFGERTMQRYAKLAQLADEEPDELLRLAHLGVSKLHRLAALPPGTRRLLKVRTPIPIPGAGLDKTVEAMSARDLDRVIGGLATPPVPRTPIDKIVQGYRFRLAGLQLLNDELFQHAREVDPLLASELAAELHGLAEALESGFPL